MSHDMLRVIYFSHHAAGTADDLSRWDIDAILEVSQRNNARAGVTGALIFNAGIFGQILEGPAAAVEETFERIQMDERHDDITVLDSSHMTERAFGNWSMGFVGADTVGAQIYGDLAEATGFDIARLSGNELFQALHALSLRKEIVMRAA